MILGETTNLFLNCHCQCPHSLTVRVAACPLGPCPLEFSQIMPSDCAPVWAAVFTCNPYLLISINELLISIIHLLISINIDTSIFIDINNSFIDINNSFIGINKDGCCIHLY